MKVFWKSLLAAVVLVAGCYVFDNWIKLQQCNQSPLEIHSFCEKDSPYHPSVLYFEQPVNEYSYWMVETPFPNLKPYSDRWECPSIHASNDGIHWTEPAQNPITDLNEEEIKNLDYYSDPHLIITGPSRFECWYRLTRRHGIVENHSEEVMLMRQTSNDFTTWSSPELLLTLSPSCDENKGVGRMVVSPAIIYRDSTYQMWYVDRQGDKTQARVAFSTSADGKNWSDKRTCMLRGEGGVNIIPWHIDVTILDNTYWLVIYDTLNPNLSLWHSSDGIVFDYVKTLLRPSHIPGSFYSDWLYRSCLIKAEGKYYLYFSAFNYYSTYIGLMAGDSPESLEVVSVDGKPFTNFFKMLYPLCSTTYRSVKETLSRLFD